MHVFSYLFPTSWYWGLNLPVCACETVTEPSPSALIFMAAFVLTKVIWTHCSRHAEMTMHKTDPKTASCSAWPLSIFSGGNQGALQALPGVCVFTVDLCICFLQLIFKAFSSLTAPCAANPLSQTHKWRDIVSFSLVIFPTACSTWVCLLTPYLVDIHTPALHLSPTPTVRWSRHTSSLIVNLGLAWIKEKHSSLDICPGV